MAQVHDCERSSLIVFPLNQQAGGICLFGAWIFPTAAFVCPHVCLHGHIQIQPSFTNILALQPPTLLPLDRRHWVDNVRFQLQEGIALLQYIASYFCFLQHFPHALLVIIYIVEVYSIFFFSHSKQLLSFCSIHCYLLPVFHGCT